MRRDAGQDSRRVCPMAGVSPSDLEVSMSAAVYGHALEHQGLISCRSWQWLRS
jgi:hypothetical protein